MGDNGGSLAAADDRMSPTPPVSLTRYLIEEQREGRIGPNLRLLIEVVARACKSISIQVGKGALGDILGTVMSDATIAVGLVALIKPFAFEQHQGAYLARPASRL